MSSPVSLHSMYDAGHFLLGDLEGGAAHGRREDNKVKCDGCDCFYIFGRRIENTTLERSADWIISNCIRGKSTTVAFLNADCVNILHRSSEYQIALRAFDRIYADGIGLRIASWLAGVRLKDNVNGTDLFPVLCRKATQSGQKIYLLGAKPGVAQAAADRMADDFVVNPFVGCQHGYFDPASSDAEIVENINQSGADIVLVGLGAPRQEVWIARNRHRLNAQAVIGVGGLFDYYSGNIPRAPLMLRKNGMEWVWRLAMEPSRLADRYVRGNIEFLMRLGALRVIGQDYLQRPALDNDR